ncbi:hypothetical protein MMO38_06635 [Acinetobacter sp. NIPH 1852]|uniref:hypothetical protein n=1 Tax=Acinetobacter sp. NIPH 1852 TaxID=2923428 RepID=UPI001F4A6266|nr:hypothetical protein [Acinetobacter sp. NIPH 1852]MCH7307816.1 hypothetical protein [Acinetobacter sp. NIPH 1852]
MRDFICLESKRLTNKYIQTNKPQGCTHFALPRVSTVCYYLIDGDVIFSWKDDKWIRNPAKLEGLIRFGILPINFPEIDYSFLHKVNDQ